MAASLAVAGAPLIGGCAPGQVVFHVDTDAPVRRSALEAAGAPWLFDQLSVELLDAGGAVVMERAFAVDAEDFERKAVSFGVADQGQARTVRLRLYRGDHAPQGLPSPSSTIERIFRVPAATDGALHVRGLLPTAEVGRVQPAPLEPEAGEVGASRVGSWEGAREVPCAGAPGPDEACVPGGAFWMGSPEAGGGGERLVVVSPFYLGRHEVTPDDVRVRRDALNAAGAASPYHWPGVDPLYGWCTYTSEPSARSGLPVNCLSWSTATAYCGILGRQLPTEAQLEFAASRRGAESPYPWGIDPPGCQDAVFARSGVLTRPQRCATGEQANGPLDPGSGPLPPGSGARDRLRLGSSSTAVEILDLAGNVAELTLDGWSELGAAAGAPAGVVIDPVAPPAADGAHPVRGGGWREESDSLTATTRRSLGKDFVSDDYGFRCARDGR